VVETLCNVVGNLVLQQWDSDVIITPTPSLYFMEALVTTSFWSILVSRLPVSSYCCACIIRVDTVHFAMDFLRPFQDKIPETFSNLLLNHETYDVETVWMLEGLTRRETAAVNVLFSMNEFSTTAQNSLLSQLIQRIHYHTEIVLGISGSSSSNRNVDTSKAFLVPALRVIGNVAVALDSDRQMLLSQPLLLQAINCLLDQRTSSNAATVIVDVIQTVCNLLILGSNSTAGLSSNYTLFLDIFTSHFLPRLVRICTDENSRREWKRESVLCIAHVLVNYCNHDVSTLLLQEVIWNNNQQTQGNVLMQSLLDMIQAHDTDVVFAVMTLLDRLLRTINDSLAVFKDMNGVDKLERICSTTQAYDYKTQELAAQLMDDYFDSDDDEENEMKRTDSTTNPSIVMNQFAFGGVSSNVASNGHGWHQSSEMTVEQHVASNGRGRGRVLPAWLAQQQQQQSSS
jgi:hypothetical protein